MQFSAKYVCVFVICLGIRKSAKHNFESKKKILFVKNQKNWAPEASPVRQQRVKSRWRQKSLDDRRTKTRAEISAVCVAIKFNKFERM